MKDLLVWVLADDRPGNVNQAINLAKSLEVTYKIKHITYNKFSQLPNLILKKSLFFISKNSRESLIKDHKKPDIIISAGRKTAAISHYLKNNLGKKIFNISIMRPQINISNFNLIIAPFHDNLKAGNVISIPGAINNIDVNLAKAQYQKFSQIFAKNHQNISLFLGGPSKNSNFNEASAKEIAICINKICNQENAKLLISTSRRTTNQIISQFKQNLNCNYQIFPFDKNKDKDPYLALLYKSNYTIISGDSISIISEACFFDNLVYVYSNSKICSKKHLKFHQSLSQKKYLKLIDNDCTTLEQYQKKPMQADTNIAFKIRAKISEFFKFFI